MDNHNSFPDSTIFNLNQTGLPDPKEEEYFKDEPYHWLKSIFWAKNNLEHSEANKIYESIDVNSIKVLSGSIMSEQMDFTHEGLIQYIYTCWAHELGVVLKPDMFFYTILSEIKILIINNPDTFKKLFTKSNEKIQVTIVGLTVDKLISRLETLIPSKELFDIVTKTNFKTAPNHFPQVLGITMADMGTPYYSYSTTRCGIPKIMIVGNKDEWTKLIDAVDNLKNIFSPFSKQLTNYLTNIRETLNKIMIARDQNNVEFFKNMFSYERNKYCGSGHTKIIINGWINGFYLEKFPLISDFSSHINCLPYDDRDDPNNIKYYFYVCGLTSSKLVDGYMFPQYDIAHCQITHPDSKIIFDGIACNLSKKIDIWQ